MPGTVIFGKNSRILIAPLTGGSVVKPSGGSFATLCAGVSATLKRSVNQVTRPARFCDDGKTTLLPGSPSADLSISDQDYFRGDTAYDTIHAAHFSGDSVFVIVQPNGAGTGKPSYEFVAKVFDYQFDMSAAENEAVKGPINLTMVYGDLTPVTQP